MKAMCWYVIPGVLCAHLIFCEKVYKTLYTVPDNQSLLVDLPLTVPFQPLLFVPSEGYSNEFTEGGSDASLIFS